MSSQALVAATRLNLIRTRRSLSRITRGIGMLRRKREAIVSELFSMARPAVDARARVAEQAARAYRAELEALAAQGEATLRSLGWPTRDITMRMDAAQVWGIPASGIVERSPVVRTAAARGAAPGASGPAAVEAAARFERLVDLLLESAPLELRLRRLGEALARTTRQVNTLEQRLEPAMKARAAAIARTLEEREREDRSRLRLMLSK